MPVRPAESGDRPARNEERPGVLRGGATLTLQTRQAQRLVKGRGYTAEKPAITGLIGFANLLRSIWHGARADVRSGFYFTSFAVPCVDSRCTTHLPTATAEST